MKIKYSLLTLDFYSLKYVYIMTVKKERDIVTINLPEFFLPAEAIKMRNILLLS